MSDKDPQTDKQARGIPANDDPAPAANNDLQLVYVADPMCSWCYGFSTTIAALANQFEGRMELWPLMGGLRAGNTLPMTDADKEYIKDAWGKVQTASGLRFDHSFFKRETFIYDTEPVCRAVVTMRYMAPERTLAFINILSQAFYANGLDTTDPEVLIALAEQFGADKERFKRGFEMPDIAEATKHDFAMAKSLGVKVFPSLLAGNDTIGYTLLHNGFAHFEDISEQLEGWYKAQIA